MSIAWFGQGLLVATVGVGLLSAGCGRAQNAGKPSSTPSHASPVAPVVLTGQPIELPQVESRPGTAVAVLVDTSGSMNQPVRDQKGQVRPKHQIAREALERIVEQTAQWKQAHPGSTVQMGLYTFASNVQVVLPVGDFDEKKARDALGRIPRPNGGTAIGRALEEGAKGLFQSGCARKFVVCVTDGENTSGPPPDRVAHQLHSQTKGDVKLQFVAFDTSANHFKFLHDVNGEVVQASDGGQLQAELKQIYEQKILVEKEEK